MDHWGSSHLRKTSYPLSPDLPLLRETQLNQDQVRSLYALHKASEINDSTLVDWMSKNDPYFSTITHLYLDGKTALSAAILKGNTMVANTLIASNSPVNYPSKRSLNDMETPIASAIRLDLEEVVLCLIKNGESLGEQITSKSPLVPGVIRQNIKYIDILLREGAMIEFKTTEANPLNLATIFLEAGSREELMNITSSYSLHANQMNAHRIIKELIAAGINPFMKDTQNRNPLYWLITKRSWILANMLIDAELLPEEEQRSTRVIINSIKKEDSIWNPVNLILHKLNNAQPLKRLASQKLRKILRKTTRKDIRLSTKDLPIPKQLIGYVDFDFYQPDCRIRKTHSLRPHNKEISEYLIKKYPFLSISRIYRAGKTVTIIPFQANNCTLE